jgi:hypothetical protein
VIALLGALLFSMFLIRPMKGRLSLLAEAPFRYEMLLPFGFLIQVAPPFLSSSFNGGNLDTITLTAWLAGSLVLMLACLLNWRYVGFRLAMLGVALNAFVIILNQGMPVSVAALEYLGLGGAEQQVEALTPLYHLASEQTVFKILGDVLPIPGPALIRSVVSLGDTYLMVGIALVVLDGSRALIRARLAPRPGV